MKKTTNPILSLLSCLALATGGAALVTACDDGGMENAGEKVDEAAEDAGDAVEDAVDDVND